jgi:hypothetical protein
MWHIWRRGEVHVGFWGGKKKKKDHFEDPGINGRVLFSKNSMGRGIDWIDLAEDRERWWVLVKMDINLHVL